MDKIFQNVAGVDLGSTHLFISVEGQAIRRFETFTIGLDLAIVFLQQHGIERVCMEATGIYWCSFFDKVEAAKMEACLVNPRQSKSLPGRKSDVQDAEWLRQLYAHGLLRKSFVPPNSIRELRSYVRYREQRIAESTRCTLRMQKALNLMNIRLSNVLSDIVGVSGTRLVKAILAGERRAEILVELCDRQILAKKRDAVIAALQGNFEDRHLFELQKEFEAYEFFIRQISDCDQKIETALSKIEADAPPHDPEQDGKTKKSPKHMPKIDGLHQKLMRCFQNHDGSKIAGLTDYAILRILAEVGNDFSKWANEKCFTAWLALAPGKNQSGKKNRKAPPLAATRAAQIFRQSAQSLLQSKDSAIGEFARRIRAKKGAPIAIKAAARKIAAQFFNFMKFGNEYVEKGVEDYKARFRQNALDQIKRNIKKHQFDLYELELV